MDLVITATSQPHHHKSQRPERCDQYHEALRLTTYHWDTAGRLTGIDRPNGTERTNEYTPGDELGRYFERGPDGVVHSYARFGYDLDSRIDWRYRLPKPQEMTIPSFTATHDEDNRVATWNSENVTHDLDGNMTYGPLPGEENFVNYSFDARNRLTAVGGVSYTYDSENNRIAKTTPDGTTTYIFDPHGDALPRVLVRERPDDSLTYYVYGIGLLYEVNEADNATYYHFDQSGSTIALTNDAGTVTDRVEYTPYGTVSHRTGTNDTPFLYAGQFGIQADPNGLLHMRARFYSPELKCFVNADPIGFAGGLNWYSYANNSPLMFIDPSGLSAWSNYWSDVGQFYLGYVDTAVGTVNGMASFVTDPAGSVKGIATAVAHPVQTYHAISGSIGELSQTSRGQGRIVGEILLTVASGGATKATSVAGRSSKLSQVSRWGRPGLKPGDWVMKGGKTKLSYNLSGKRQRGFGNKFASFDSGTSFNVPAGDLYRPRGLLGGPSGLNPFEGRLKSLVPGQRRYNPSGQGLFSSGESALFNASRLGGIK